MKNKITKSIRSFIVFACFLAAPASLPALTIDWFTPGSTGEFGTNINWNGAVPGTNDLARITNSGTATISDGNTYEVQNLYLAGKNINNSTGTVRIINGTLKVTGSFGTVANNPQVGTGLNALGRLEIAGGNFYRYNSTNTANDQYFFIGGGGGKGFMTLSSGNVFIDYFRIGSDQSSTTGNGGVGTVDVSGGLMVITNQWLIGRDLETGILNLTGGEVINIAQKYYASNNDDYLTLAGGNTSTGIINIATGGLLRAVGGIRIGQAGVITETANGTLRINGGRLVTQRLFQGATTGTSLAKVELDGGILEATNATHASGFIYGGLNVKLKAGGVTIDSAGYSLPVFPAILQDPASTGGGITKINSGSLRLLGTNNYTGATVIQGGGLVLATGSTGGGAVTANDGSDFGAIISSAGSSLTLSTLTLNSGAGTNVLSFELGVLGNPTVPVINAATFTVSRTNKVVISGAGLSIGQFTLVQFTSGSGVTAGKFELTTLPSGVVANLVVDANALKLNVTEAPSLHWNGNINSNWDTNTANWLDFAAQPPTAKIYGEGAAVQFDDAATNFSVSLAFALSPAAITVTNQATNYVFTGPGLVAGTGSLRKQGSGSLTMGTTNTYSGDTTISAGKFLLGISEVIPHGAGKGNLVLHGTLDLNGFSEALNGLTGSGVIDNSGSLPSTITVGNQGVLSSFSGVITNSGSSSLALTKTGNNLFLLTGNNGYSGGTRINTGTIQLGGNNILGSGPLTLNGGVLTSDGSTARTVTNAVLVLAASTIGSSFFNGPLTLSGFVDFNNGTRNLTFSSDVLLSGGSTNGTINKLGTGTLTLQGAHNWNSEAEVRNGILIMDGAAVTSTSAFRPDSDIPNGVAKLVIGPGSTWVQNSTTANLRAGYDGNATATNILDIAGTASMPQANSTAAKLVLGQGDGTAYVNLLTNGLAIVRGVQKNGIGNYCELNLNGGTLQAIEASTTFMEGLNAVFVRSGGARIDSAGFNISILQDLLAGGGNGGLTKLGAGTLFLNGINTYTGNTVVSSGALGGSGIIASPLLVTAAGALAPGNSIGTMTVNNTVALQGAAILEISADGSPSSDLVQGITTLNYGGALIVTNVGVTPLATGTSFNLFDASTFTGSFASISLPPLASGLSWNTSNLSVDGTISITGTATAAPKFNGPLLAGNTLTLSGTGGTPGGTYYVLASANIALPVTNWTAIATNTFDGSGNFTFNDTLDGSRPQRFYLISTP